MRYGQIRKYDIANGPGIRTSFFLTGCDRNCKNCFNREYMDFNFGKIRDEEALREVLSYLKLDQIEGLTILGGEPLENPLGLLQALKDIRKEIDKSIWLYSGFKYEVLYNINIAREILKLVDVLVDGEFVEELKDLSLDFRGSSNQRIIDVKASLNKNKIILMNGYK
ncbi:anaerobic ribonucleoside-triphosphate reductase activating protein [Anaerococcus tetradius]|uniref:Anaerobic ribonucleoside-triphosphate reductase-activating protein n=1 Tax=Anaerococcus tetradius ATCC 35098 TaxID=525255 RepID=C2CFF7_9FIRM|nr:anaerobic ribonucleoside-triphosphate reductase activating protein [Anaerococcus tetradius]EEI83776.1 anaerobic ribonucleoside-triphosphate reductase activating protein [Anaerococcus tetradius ATCC 35098]